MTIGGNIGSSVEASVVTGESGAPPIGDSLSGAEAIYSFKKQRTAYSGSAVRVRRSTDDAEQDIGFVAGEFDASSFTSFIGAGSGFCTTWYDQSGNGADLVQGTTASQPLIQQDADGYWNLRCNNGPWMQLASFMGTQSASTVHVVWQWPNNGTTRTASAGVDFDAGLSFISPSWTTQQGPVSYISAIDNYYQVWGDTKPRHHTFTYSGGNCAITCWDANLGTAATNAPSYSRLTIGKNDFGTAKVNYYELAIWPSAVSTTTLWNNVKSEYKTMFTFSDFWLVLGDSLTETLFTGPGDNWAQKAFDNMTTPPADRMVIAQGGKRIQDWIDDKADWEWYLDNLTITGTKNAVIWCGTNDIFLDSIDGTVCWTRAETLIGHLQANGYDNIIGMTQLPRSSSSIDAERAYFNTQMKADADLADVVELDGNANLTDATNTTYFNGDQVHLKDAGALEVANEATTIFNLI